MRVGIPVLLTALVIAACGGSGTSSTAPGATSASGSAALLPDKGSVTLLTWEGYTQPEWLAAYKEKTGVEVNVIEAGSVDEMFAKAQASAGQIDVTHFDIGNIQRYKDAGLLEPFDKSLVPNASNIAPGLPWEEAFSVDGVLYGLPYNWGTLPLMWNIAAFPDPPTSWKVLWDPQYKGKVTIPDDSYLGFPMVGLAQGIEDPYQLDDAGFATIESALAELRPNLKTLTGGFNDAVQLYGTGDVIVGYCQNVAVVNDLNKDGVKFAYGYPEEGTPFWIDGAEILKGGNRQEVYDFINATMDVPWQAEFIASSGNAGIISYDAAKANVPADVLDKTEVKNLVNPNFWDAMSPMVTPNRMDDRLSIWNEFKAGS
jgi:spermidine/putrescine transport system substrate-binding protein